MDLHNMKRSHVLGSKSPFNVNRQSLSVKLYTGYTKIIPTNGVNIKSGGREGSKQGEGNKENKRRKQKQSRENVEKEFRFVKLTQDPGLFSLLSWQYSKNTRAFCASLKLSHMFSPSHDPRTLVRRSRWHNMASQYMEETYDTLARRAIEILEKSERHRVLIFVIGIPGSGKSTTARRVVEKINEMKPLEKSEKRLDKKLKRFITDDYIDKLPDFDPEEKIPFEDESFQPRKQIFPNETTKISCRGLEIDSICIKPPKGDNASYAQVVPMDGFHLPRKVLDQFHDSDFAHKRRGSPFTFDSNLVVCAIGLLKTTCLIGVEDAETRVPDIDLPGFDHCLKDPTMCGVHISSNTRILVVEGLYLLLKDSPWDGIGRMFGKTTDGGAPTLGVDSAPIPDDFFEFWKIEVPETAARVRVAKRHLESGLASCIEKGEERFDMNDGINGKRVDLNSFSCDLSVVSVEEI